MPESKSGALNHFATPQYIAVQYPKTHRYLESKVLPDLEVISLILAREVRFELTTHGLTARCANHYATLPIYLQYSGSPTKGIWPPVQRNSYLYYILLTKLYFFRLVSELRLELRHPLDVNQEF